MKLFLIAIIFISVVFVFLILLLPEIITPEKEAVEIPQEQGMVSMDKPLAVVVPHHNLVKAQRSEFLNKLSPQSQPKTIILLSPNHFNAGQYTIITTNRTWIVANGQRTILADAGLVEKLIENRLAHADNTVFDNEHGIKNLLGEIKEFFPQSTIVPIIFKETANKEEIEELANFILNNCYDCGVIASVDFSHYQPAHIAEVHDIKSLRALQNFNSNEIWDVEVYSNAALAFLIHWAKAENLKKFNLYEHTNSGILNNDFDSETTTHIFGYYNNGTSPPAEVNLTFTFAGDAMFGREIGYRFQNNNFKELFSNLGNRTFWGTDISWINLEGPISDKIVKQDPQSNDLTFNFSKQAIEALKYLKLTAVGLANNHTANQGEKGLVMTKSILERASIDWNGNPSEISEKSIKRYEKNDIKISLIAINALLNTAGTEELIKKEKSEKRFVLVLPHWGNEYQLKHSLAQEKLAKLWISTGADLIVGSHPHVIQDAQIIDNKLVFYSLGNFVFDQYFSKETQKGLIITGVIGQEGMKIVLLPIASKALKPEILRGTEKKAIIDKICSGITPYCQGDTIEIKSIDNN